MRHPRSLFAAGNEWMLLIGHSEKTTVQSDWLTPPFLPRLQPTAPMPQEMNQSDSGRPTRATRSLSWRRSSITTAIWRVGEGLRLPTHWSCPSDRLRSGSRTGAWSGRRTTSCPTQRTWRRSRTRTTRHQLRKPKGQPREQPNRSKVRWVELSWGGRKRKKIVTSRIFNEPKLIKTLYLIFSSPSSSSASDQTAWRASVRWQHLRTTFRCQERIWPTWTTVAAAVVKWWTTTRRLRIIIITICRSKVTTIWPLYKVNCGSASWVGGEL